MNLLKILQQHAKLLSTKDIPIYFNPPRLVISWQLTLHVLLLSLCGTLDICYESISQKEPSAMSMHHANKFKKAPSTKRRAYQDFQQKI